MEFKIKLLLINIAILVLMLPVSAFGYEIKIEDNAEILTKSDCEELYSAVEELSGYGDVLFYSADSKRGLQSAKSVCKNKYSHNSSVTIFYINMGTRTLTIYVNGEVGKKVSEAKCITIADNVYKLASNADYKGCAIQACLQVLKVIKGEAIDAPMQLASNIFLAIIISMLINYLLVKLFHGNRKINNVRMIEEAGNYVWFSDNDSCYAGSSRQYSPRSRRHGGRGGGFGGGFGGGGHGGSHRF